MDVGCACGVNGVMSSDKPRLSEPPWSGSISEFASDDCEILGYSPYGRPVVVRYCGSRTADLRIFILAGQHGDEGDARDAAAELLVRWSNGAMRSGAQLAVVA